MKIIDNLVIKLPLDRVVFAKLGPYVLGLKVENYTKSLIILVKFKHGFYIIFYILKNMKGLKNSLALGPNRLIEHEILEYDKDGGKI